MLLNFLILADYAMGHFRYQLGEETLYLRYKLSWVVWLLEIHVLYNLLKESQPKSLLIPS